MGRSGRVVGTLPGVRGGRPGYQGGGERVMSTWYGPVEDIDVKGVHVEGPPGRRLGG